MQASTQASGLTLDEFDEATLADWQAQVERDLKGKKTAADLVYQVEPGLELRAYYTREQASESLGDFHLWLAEQQSAREVQSVWELNVSSDAEADQALRHAAEFEVGKVLLRGSTLRSAYGVSVWHPGQGGIYTTTAWLNGKGPLPIESLLSAVEKQEPILLAGHYWADQGFAPSWQLSLALLALEELDRSFQNRGIATERWLPLCQISLGTSTEYLTEIAKIRAFRLLVGQWLAAKGMPPIYIPVWAYSARLTQSQVDLHTNLLRHSIEGLAAVVGGADYLVLAPHNARNPQVDTPMQALRWSAHILNLMKYEGRLGQVRDVAAGSWFAERLTLALAEKAWIQVQELSQASPSLSQAWEKVLPALSAQAMNDLASAYQTGNKVLVGSNKYPYQAEYTPKAPQQYETEEGGWGYYLEG